MSESEADKKRNKLGYQRISVACGHCRRRKIRCVLADGDPQNRCSNCIRLGKQCVFYPVDSTTPADSKAGSSSSKTSATPNIASSVASHSPDLAAGRGFDSTAFPTVPSVPSNVPQGYSGIAYEGGYPGQGPEYGFRPPEYLRQQWSAPGDLSPATQAAMAGPVGGYAPGTIAAYSPFTGGDSIHSTPTDTRSYSFPAPDDERQWQMYQQQHPGRAMSYGHYEAMQTSYAQPAPVYATMPTQGVGPQFGLPALDMQSAQMHAMSGPQSAPASAPMPVFNPGMAYAYPPGSMPPQPGQPGWYPPPGSYDPYGQGHGEGEGSSRRTQR